MATFKDNINIAFQVDRFSDAGSRTIALLRLSKCGWKKPAQWVRRSINLGPHYRCSLPRLHYSASGILYLSFIYVAPISVTSKDQRSKDQRFKDQRFKDQRSKEINNNGLVVMSSTDFGVTWSRPKFLITTPFNLSDRLSRPAVDNHSLTTIGNRAFTAFDLYEQGVVRGNVSCYGNRSFAPDRRCTWASAQLIYNATNDLHGLSNGLNSCNQVVNNQIVQSGGKLYIFMRRVYAKPTASEAEYQSDTFPFRFTNGDYAYITSDDLGLTWSKATVVASYSPNLLIFTKGYRYNISNEIIGGQGEQLRTVISSQGAVYGDELYLVFLTDMYNAKRYSQVALYASKQRQTILVSDKSEKSEQSEKSDKSERLQAFTPTIYVDAKYIYVMYSIYKIRTQTVQVYLVVFDKCLQLIQKSKLSGDFSAENSPLTNSGYMPNNDYNSIQPYGNKILTVHTETSEKRFSPKLIEQQGRTTITSTLTPMDVILNSIKQS